MHSACESGVSSACMSISAKCATRSPVVMSSTTVGLSWVIDIVMSLAGGRPSGETPPGNDITIGAAGEKPSALFQPLGSTVVPSKFVGSVLSGIASFLPVAVVASSTSNAEFGHGVMQWLIPSGLHCAWIGSAVSLLQAVRASAEKTIDLRPRIASTLHRVRAAATGFREYCGYIQTVRCCLVILVAFGCGGTSPEVKQDTHAGQGSGSAIARPGTGTGSSAGSAAAIAPDVGCLTATCAYHPGTATYFTSLAGGAGVCFHFGAPCAPTNACMFSFDDGLYHHCDEIAGGTCKRYGALCAP